MFRTCTLNKSASLDSKNYFIRRLYTTKTRTNISLFLVEFKETNRQEFTDQWLIQELNVKQARTCSQNYYFDKTTGVNVQENARYDENE